MANIQFKTVDATKWESLTPPTPAKTPDKYTPVLDALEAGEILEIPTANNKEMKGLKITLGRKSAIRGFKVETRSEGNTLYIRKSETPLDVKLPKARKKKEPATV